ncbi:MAG: GntR family phosphonate transport system transcriptional regulator [Pseudorhodobacter sp.]|jgi:GntR family phosphonate transport system transcriptional regulator
MVRSAIWASIADTISQEIETGHYGAGDKLPTEAALSQRFGVNRHTVRHALAALAEVGAVHARRGSGVFVAARPAAYPLGRRVRFHQNILASGRTPSRQILRLETRAADAVEAENLAIAAGAPVHVVGGLSLADAAPIAMFSSILPAAVLPRFLEVMRQTQSVTASLAQLGVADYTRRSTKISAIAADALMALHLRLREGAPVLRTVAVNVDAAGRPVEYGTAWFAGDRVTITLAEDDVL